VFVGTLVTTTVKHDTLLFGGLLQNSKILSEMINPSESFDKGVGSWVDNAFAGVKIT
jgi:hypothetical protein